MPKQEPGPASGRHPSGFSSHKRCTSGIDEREFLGDEKTIDAVARNLEIIGEAARLCLTSLRRSTATFLGADCRTAKPNRPRLLWPRLGNYLAGSPTSLRDLKARLAALEV
jgi:hypothetical protein